MEYNIHKVVEEMVIEFKETEEEFIFTHLQPYCENVLEMKIDKKELRQILLRGTKQKKGKWIHYPQGSGIVVCNQCKGIQRDCRVGYTNFCNKCGADMREVEE